MTNKLPTIKRSVSFREDVFDTAMDMANKYFGGNFSAYLTYLVCADKHGLSRVQQTEDIVEKKEEIKENVNNYVKNDANEDYINNILGM